MPSARAISILWWIAPRLALLVACAILAAVCNTLVAWGASVLHDPGTTPLQPAPPGAIIWPTAKGDPAIGDQLDIVIASGAACDWFDAYVHTNANETRDWVGLPTLWAESMEIMDFDGVGLRAGWPYRSLYVCVADPTVARGDPRKALLNAPIIIGGWRVPWAGETRVLPMTVLAWGTAVNILVYTLLLLGLLAGPRVLRSIARRQSHRCVDCGYPVGNFAICPECGRPVA